MLLHSPFYLSSHHSLSIHCLDTSPGPSLSPEEIMSAALVEYTNLPDQDLVNATEIKSCDTPRAVMLMTRLQVIVDNLQALSITPALSESINTLLAVRILLTPRSWLTQVRKFGSSRWPRVTVKTSTLFWSFFVTSKMSLNDSRFVPRSPSCQE